MRRQQLFGHNGNSRAPFIFLRPVVAIADDLEVIAEILNHVAELEALKKSAVPQGITHKSQALNGHGLLAEAQFLDLLRGQKRFVAIDADVTFHDFSSLSANVDSSASVRLQIVPKSVEMTLPSFAGSVSGGAREPESELVAYAQPCMRGSRYRWSFGQ
ncbi:MAG: hypothetical protein ACLTXW_15440 [Christensenellales bacterium]